MLRFLNTSLNPSFSLATMLLFNAHQHLPSTPLSSPGKPRASPHKARYLPAREPNPVLPPLLSTSPPLWVWANARAVNIPRLRASFAGKPPLPLAAAGAVGTCAPPTRRRWGRPRGPPRPSLQAARPDEFFPSEPEPNAGCSAPTAGAAPSVRCCPSLRARPGRGAPAPATCAARWGWAASAPA